MKWYLIINPKLFHYYSKNYGDWEYFFIFISLKFMSYSKDLITTVSIQFLSTWKLSVKNNSESCI